MMDCVPKLSGLKRHTFILQFLRIRNPGISWLGPPLQGLSQAAISVAQGLLQGLRQGSTGIESTSKFIHIFVGNFQEFFKGHSLD